MSNEPDTITDSLQRDQFTVRKERLYGRLIGASAILTILVTGGIILSLSGHAITFWSEIPPIEFFTGTNWAPKTSGAYGFLPLLSGTLLVTVFSALIALPIGLAAAIYLSEYASGRVRAILKPALEVLAGVPTVIYGYMALVYVTPLIDSFLPIQQQIHPFDLPYLPALDIGFVPDFTFVVPSLRTFNVLSASIVVGIMIIPMVSSISEDALSAVPDSLREAAYGLGSTKFDTSTKVVVPAATSGIVASYVLAISRAIGETMAVTMAMGMSPRLPEFSNIFETLAQSNQTITAAMVQIAGADSLSGNVGYESMFALGISLFAVTLLMNVFAEMVRRRFREEY